MLRVAQGWPGPLGPHGVSIMVAPGPRPGGPRLERGDSDWPPAGDVQPSGPLAAGIPVCHFHSGSCAAFKLDRRPSSESNSGSRPNQAAA
jgi:hypothetical protein